VWRYNKCAMPDDPSSLEIAPFSFGNGGDVHFEKLAKANGTRYWFARDLMRAMGYESWSEFTKSINRAVAACTTLNINVAENFVQHKRNVNGKNVDDFKLTRFACCLTAMNGDPKKPYVAAAQAYFIALAEVLQDVRLPAETVDRIIIREEISDREITLNEAAAAAGVEFYARFQNAGYRGMYNMEYMALKQMKGIPDLKRSLLDFMGKDELAGNLFRLTLTEGRIRKENARGQRNLEDIAEQVGRRVRRTMIEETGVRPEEIPIAPDIKTVRRGLRDAQKGFEQLDDLEAQRMCEAETIAELPAASREIVPDCPECAAGSPYAHFGSSQCTSGSLASGGKVAHCSCDYCA
jgi:DNA-damage-inducible protein D